MLADHDKVVVVWLDVSTAFGHEHVNACLDEPLARHRGGDGIASRRYSCDDALCGHGKDGYPICPRSCAVGKSACRQDHRVVQRSSAKVEQSMDGHNCGKKEVAAPDQSKRW
jgi:hypothetical protein